MMTFWRKGRLAIAKALRLDLTHAQTRYGDVLKSYVTPGVRWLDLGCGRQVVPEWAMPRMEQEKLQRSASLLVGVDVDEAMRQHPLLQYKVFALGGSLPFHTETFDLVTANMVVEHIPAPEGFLADIHRVLRPGGRFLFHTPNYRYYLVRAASLVPDAWKTKIVWVLERRNQEDVFPTHYKLNTEDRIGKAASQAGFAVERLTTVSSSGAFYSMGPIGWVECLILKAVSVAFNGRFDSNIIAVLRRV